MVEFFNFVVSVGADWYIIGTNFGMQQLEYQQEIPALQRKVKARGFATFIIADQKIENLNWVPNSTVHFLESQVRPSSTVIHIFGEYVAHILWQKPEFVFVFKNQAVAEDYRKYYHLLQKNIEK